MQDIRKAPCHDCHKGERNLGEVESSGILVNQSVIVSPHGTDNFTTIGDAIAFSPNNSKPEDGYFVIYAREAVYEEYVVVPKHKKNLLLIGDGINRTVITGNHSVIDGWTTFNSSTFGKQIIYNISHVGLRIIIHSLSIYMPNDLNALIITLRCDTVLLNNGGPRMVLTFYHLDAFSFYP